MFQVVVFGHETGTSLQRPLSLLILSGTGHWVSTEDVSCKDWLFPR